MVKIRKYANGIERFLHGQTGQRFFNFAYSIGAAVVILGALFKILHLPGGNEMLMVGMGTEVAMFILTAFDRPPREYAWEDVFPVLDTKDPADRPKTIEVGALPEDEVSTTEAEAPLESPEGDELVAELAGTDGSQYIITDEEEPSRYAPPAPQPQEAQVLSPDETLTLRESISRMAAASEQLSRMADMATATTDYLDQISQIAQQMGQLRETTAKLNEVSSILLDSYRAVTDNSESISKSSTGYVERMEDLNRNIGGLNTIYEIQLKSISSQLESIDRVNRGLKDIKDMYEKSAAESSRYCEETEKMARYMRQLNSVYEKMITAMTVNMYNPMMGQPQQAQPQPQAQPEQPATPFPASED